MWREWVHSVYGCQVAEEKKKKKTLVVYKFIWSQSIFFFFHHLHELKNTKQVDIGD